MRVGARVAPDPEPRQGSEESSGGAPRGSEARLAVHSSLAPSPVDPASLDPRVPATHDTTRLGPYQIVCELASGGMATVYLALYRSIEGFEKLCAVKRIHPHLANDRAFTNMFADEAQIAARISHPHVCSVFSFGRTNQSHYLAMEFLRGEPLSAVSRRVARSPELGDDPRFPLLAARLVANFAEGLYAAHTLRDDRGVPLEVVHRDVTPQNLFVLYDGSVRVTDFGIAHARRRLHHTQGQKLKGKLSYIAPEQLNGGAVDARVDIWGLGVTLWELLAGRRLFLGSSEGETLAAVVSRVVQAPSVFRATVPLELDRIVLRALDRDVNKRYRTARDLTRDLERFLTKSGDQVPAMDVADWMATVFPQGAERIQALTELAARVSAATADETVVRVPSVPPSTPPSKMPSRGSFVVHAAAPIGSSSMPPSAPPTRELNVIAASATASAEAPVPASEPKRSEAGSAQRGSKPRLVLVEEVSAERALPTSAPSKRRWLLPMLVTLLLALGTGTWLVKVAGRTASSPTPQVRAADPGRPLAPVDTHAAAPLPAPAPAVATSPAAPTHEAAPTSGTSKAASKRSVTNAVPTVPASAAPPMGDVFVTTPGGSGEVFEQGRLLGHAPGTFRLGVGHHDLTLRTSHGTSRTVSVNIVRGTPTLVTVDASH